MKEQIISLYKAGLSRKAIARQLGCTNYKVRMALLNIDGAVLLPDENVCQGIIHSYTVENISTNEICKKFHVDHSTIKAVFSMYGIKESRRKTRVNDSYFKDIDTEHKAYWLGFLMADGYNDESQRKIEITLKHTDLKLLEAFKKDIESEHKISEKIIGKYKAYRIAIRSDQLSTDLARHGCVQQKSLILEFPKIPSHLVNHFIRGYFDGDGSVTIRGKACNFHLLGTKQFIESCREAMGMHYTKLSKKGNVYDLRYSGRNNLETIYNYLYKDATIFLERKHNEFVKCKLPS